MVVFYQDESKSVMADLRDMQIEELEDVLVHLGEPRFRAKQLYEWFHKHGVQHYGEMTNLPKSLRDKLEASFPLNSLQEVETKSSDDKSKKYLVQLQDGLVVETVGMPVFKDPACKSISRLTACVSTQVGCPMSCTFCATGQLGLTRNLETSEIVDQVLKVQNDFGAPVTNVVVMGQGEPFLNYDNVLKALRRINQDEALKIGARKITVSTVGLVDGIERFAKEP